MNSGWIKLYRQLKDWEWYKKENMVHLFIHLLLSANHEEGMWQGIKILRGQLVTGRNSLKKDTGISDRSIRTCLERLKSTNEVTIKSTNKYSIITLCNYDSYQVEDKKVTSKTTSKPPNERPTNDQQTTTNKNNKNDNNIKEYSPDVIDIYEYSKSYFDEKYLKDEVKETFRKLIEIDNYQVEEIKNIIKAARTDNFWSKNFMSPNKLRDKDKNGVIYFDKFKVQFNIKSQQKIVKTITLQYNGKRVQWPEDDIQNGKVQFSNNNGGFDPELVQVV
jgi:hypothetical protein